MKKILSKKSLPLAARLLVTGVNAALFAAGAPALANNGQVGNWHAITAGAHSAGTSAAGAAATGWVPAHFGSASTLVHPHGPSTTLAGTFNLTAPTAVTVPNFHAGTLSSAALAIQPVNFDLSSTKASIVLPSSLVASGATVTISIAGQDRTFHGGDRVTAAEYVAISQALGGGQSIVLDLHGRADGGSFSLNGLADGGALAVGGLTIPKNVTALDYLSGSNNLSLSGNLLNYGSIEDIAKSGAASANISALNLVNEKTGLIITLSNNGGIVDLTLSATNNFSNLGNISGSGNVTINAGGTIANGGTTTGAQSAQPVISAAKDLSLQAPIIQNSGLVSSAGGNINLSAPANQTLAVTATGGTFSAANGAINVRGTSYIGTADTTVTGGNFLSQQVNLNAGGGTLDFNAGNVTGVVSSTGNAVHVSASTANLVLGNQTVTGDPTFYNDSGDISITGDVTSPESIAIIASGNITASGAAVTQITSTGGTITMLAGAEVTGLSGSASKTIPPGNPGTASVSGVSGTGGNIDLSAAASTLTISAPNGVTLAAFNANTANTGVVSLPSSSVVTGNAGSGKGDAVIIAGQKIGVVSITANEVDGNNVYIIAAQPQVTNGPLLFNKTGDMVQGTISVDFSQLTGNVVMAGGTIKANNNAELAGGQNMVLPAVTADNFTAVTAGPISLTSNITTSHNAIFAAGADFSDLVPGIQVVTNAGGNIVAVAGGQFSINATGLKIDQLLVTGPNANNIAGQITLNSNDIFTTQNASGTSGNIVLAAFPDSSSNGGTITTPILNVGSIGNTSGSIEITAPNNIIMGANINFDGTSTGSALSLLVANPNISTPVNLLAANPSFAGGAFAGSGNFSIAAGSISINGASVTIQQPDALTVGSSLFAGIPNNFTGVSATSISLNSFNISGTMLLNTPGNINVTGSFSANNVMLLAAGSIDSTSALIDASKSILMIAGQDIIGTSSFQASATSGGNGGNVDMLAGADFQFANNQVLMNGPSTSGGNIDFSGALGPLISTSAFIGNSNAGNITLAAFLANSNGGTISFPSTGSFFAIAAGTGTLGNITVLAGALAGSKAAITLSSLNGGTTVIANTQPIVTNGPITFDTTGTILSGSLSGNLSSPATGDIKWIGASTSSVTNLTVVTGGNIVMPSSMTAISATVAANLNISVGTLNATNGVVLVAGGSVLANPGLGFIGSQKQTNIIMVAGADFTVASTGLSVIQITVNGADSNGGNIDLSGGTLNINAGGGPPGTNGGNAILAAFAGMSPASSGFVNLAGNSINSSTGAGGTTNGNIEITAGALAANAVFSTGNISSNGGTSPSGNISILAVQPDAGTGVNLLGSTPSFVGGTLQSGTTSTISLGTINVGGGNLTLVSQGALTLPTVSSGSAATYSAQSNSDVNISNPLGSVQALIVNAGGNINVGKSITATDTITLLAQGGVSFTGSGIGLTSLGGLLIVSGGNISATGSGTSLSTAGATQSGDMALVAGAAFTVQGNQVQITGQNLAGGGIDLTGGSNVGNITAAATPGNSGNISLIAFNGNINLPGPAINDNGAKGNVTIIAGTAASNSISIGGITSTDANGGDIFIAAATPNASAASPVVLNFDATRASGDFKGGGIAIGAGNLSLNSITMGGHGNFSLVQDLSLITGSNVPAVTNANQLTLETLGGIIVNSTLSANSIQLLVGNSLVFANINIMTDVQYPGGITLVATNNITANTALKVSTATAGDAGQINMIAGAQFSYDGTKVTVTDATGAGNIDLSQVTLLSSQSTGGRGGDINLVAGGSIAVNSAVTIATSGNTGSSNGSFVAVAGKATGVAVNVGNVDVTGGASNPGSGSITLQSVQPSLTATAPLVIANGVVLSGSPVNLIANSGSAADVNALDLTARGGNINVLSSQNVVIGNIDASAPVGSVLTGGNVNVTTNGTKTLQIGGTTSTNFINSIAFTGDTNTNGNLNLANLDAAGTGNGGITLAVGGIPFTPGQGGNISLTAGSATNDTISLGSNNTFDLTGPNASGTVVFLGNAITWTGTLTVDVHGVNGTAGDIFFEQAGTTALTINSSTNNISFNAAGAPGQAAGTITIANGGNLTFDPTSKVLNIAANAGGGSAGGLDLEAGWFNGAPIGKNANLLVTGPISLNGIGANGTGGQLMLRANSSTAFNIGLATKNTNGVAGAISLIGSGGNGTLVAQNASGDITNSVALTQVNAVSLTAGGGGNVVVGAPLGTAPNPNNPSAPSTQVVTLQTTGTGAVSQSKSTNIVSAGEVFLQTTSGDIGGKSVVAINSPNPSITGGGIVNVSDSALIVNLAQATAGASSAFAVTAANQLNMLGVTAGSIAIKANDISYGGSLAGSKTGTILLTALTGDITDISNDDISAGGAITLSALKGQVGAGTIGLGAFAPSSVTITALNNAGVGGIMANGNVIIKQTSSFSTGSAFIGGDLILTNPAAVATITSAGVAGGVSVFGDIDGGKSITLTATNGFIQIGGVGGTTAPQSLTLTASSGVDVHNDITVVNALVIKTTSSSNAGGIGEVHLDGNALVTSSTGTITITSTGIDDAIDVGSLDALKSVALTATRGALSTEGIGDNKTPLSVSLSALGFIETSDITAVKTIAVITTGKTFPDGDIFLGGDIKATDSKGSITVTSSSQADGIGASGDISAATVTLTAAKSAIQVQTIGFGTPSIPVGKVTLTALNNIQMDDSIAASTSLTATATAATGTIQVEGVLEAGTAANVGTVSFTAGGNITGGSGFTVTAGKSVAITSKGGDVIFNTGIGSGPTVRPQTATIKAFANLTMGEVDTVGAISVSTTGKVAGSTLEVDGPFTTQQGAISIVASGSFLNVDGNLSADSSTSAKATILIQESNKAGFISLNNSTMSTGGTGGGDINIAIGSPGKNANTTNPNPGPILVTGNAGKNQVYWGTPGVVDPSSDGQFTIKGASVIFTGSQANSIFFTGVNITADPVIQPTAESRTLPPLIAAPPANTIVSFAIPTQVQQTAALMPAAMSQQGPITSAGTDAGVSALSGVTSLAAGSEQMLQGKAEYFTPAARMISESELDGGEVPVVLLRGDMEIDRSAAWEWCVLDGQAPQAEEPVHAANLSRGAVLAMPEHDTTVRTKHGDIIVGARSVVLIVSVQDGVAIYNLDDRKTGSVSINTDGSKLEIRPGTSTFITSESVGSYEQVNPVRLVCHRGMHVQKLGGGRKAFRSEFSLPSAFAALRPLRQMLSSQDKADLDRANHLLKTTSILLQLQGGGEAFRQMLPPQVTALANR